MQRNNVLLRFLYVVWKFFNKFKHTGFLSTKTAFLFIKVRLFCCIMNKNSKKSLKKGQKTPIWDSDLGQCACFSLDFSTNLGGYSLKYSLYTVCSLRCVYLTSGNKIGASIFVEIAFEIGILDYLYNRKYNQIHLLAHKLIGEVCIYSSNQSCC